MAQVRKKTTHQLDTPFSTTPWPEISQDDQDAILEVLCSLLSPIGSHRRDHIHPSEGKRAARRKRRRTENKEDPQGRSTAVDLPSSVPTPPELIKSIDVGFNSITRTLQAIHSPVQQDISSSSSSSLPPSSYSMVFVSRGSQSPAFNAHFPQMVSLASHKLLSEQKQHHHPEKEGNQGEDKELADERTRGIRLVGFSKACSERLSSCLHLARVSSIAIRKGAPGAGPLEELVFRTVPAAEVPWYGEARRVEEYRATKINSAETTVGDKRVKTVSRGGSG